ncbi:hypothetical protein EDEG_00231 [Edhazardia aedis USNM 41457]|uniref:Uncharacterized protein n=1 Tax=Edhazardia aedis (strain USNM 41457) TaxID=1003232 RepID=J9D636_EDHAE|nr:hypothetical protein EDEG_00231 [Edhazardia aedis USNM 41457]|eukprot:EJW03251.1 hypothetical protein EDEG_00231 [Edhazardia aedis USNM 41457]
MPNYDDLKKRLEDALLKFKTGGSNDSLIVFKCEHEQLIRISKILTKLQTRILFDDKKLKNAKNLTNNEHNRIVKILNSFQQKLYYDLIQYKKMNEETMQNFVNAPKISEITFKNKNERCIIIKHLKTTLKYMKHMIKSDICLLISWNSHGDKNHINNNRNYIDNNSYEIYTNYMNSHDYIDYYLNTNISVTDLCKIKYESAQISAQQFF